MNLTEDIIKSISNREFSFDFLEIRLTQMKEDNPRVYNGSGSITFDNDGQLSLKMYHIYLDPNEYIEEFRYFLGNNHVPGQIISKENFFEMNATDVTGNSWKADYLSLSGNINMPSNGRIITSKVNSIITTSETARSSNFKAILYTHSEFDYPTNTGGNKQDFIAHDRCHIKQDGFDCNIRKIDEGLIEIKSSLENSFANESSSDVLIEALSISAGRYIHPLIKVTQSSQLQKIAVYSHNKKLESKAITPPFPTKKPNHTIDLANFIFLYLISFNDAKSSFFSYWYRILDASNSEIENQALIVTTSIEGVLKTYFTDYGKPEPETINAADFAVPLIKSLAIDENIKGRVLSTLGNIKGFTAKNALHNLKNSQKLSKEMVGAWSDLRNKCAHADQLKFDDVEFQKFLDQTFCCIGLFYSLLFLRINYSGSFINYSKYAWPQSVLNVEEQ